MNYETFSVNIENKVAHVRINRPKKANSLNQKAWEELKEVFETLDETPEARAIVLSGEGKHFCAGIDLNLLMGFFQTLNQDCEGRKREQLRKFILQLQAAINAIEKCRKPVLAAVHNGCIGGGLDIVAACDMRYATNDAYFTIKEISIGMVADLGTLQRLPKIIPYGIAAEMAYTGRHVSGLEAKSFHLVNQTYDTKEEMLESVIKIAEEIASHAPIAIRGTKHILQFSRDNPVTNSLDYMATWNAGMILSKDLTDAFQAKMMGGKAEFID